MIHLRACNLVLGNDRCMVYIYTQTHTPTQTHTHTHTHTHMYIHVSSNTAEHILIWDNCESSLEFPVGLRLKSPKKPNFFKIDLSISYSTIFHLQFIRIHRKQLWFERWIIIVSPNILCMLLILVVCVLVVVLLLNKKLHFIPEALAVMILGESWACFKNVSVNFKFFCFVFSRHKESKFIIFDFFFSFLFFFFFLSR